MVKWLQIVIPQEQYGKPARVGIDQRAVDGHDNNLLDIRSLDLSKSLIHSWSTIAAIARELQCLQGLYLK